MKVFNCLMHQECKVKKGVMFWLYVAYVLLNSLCEIEYNQNFLKRGSVFTCVTYKSVSH